MRLAITFQRVDPSKGGAETYVADLCGRLIARGHEVTLFASEWDQSALPRELICRPIAARGATRSRRTWNFANDSHRALLVELIARAPFDCVLGFINTYSQDVLVPQGGVHEASLVANAMRFPAGWRRALYMASKRLNPKSWGVYRRIERAQYDPARSTRFVAVSHMVARDLQQYRGVAPDRIRVIPNAIDADRLRVADPAASRRAIREKHGLAETDLAALFVAHNFRLKGLPPLLEALAKRSRNDPSVRPIHLFVCGGGKLPPMRTLVDRLGLAETVHLVGFAPSVKDYFHAADFFVLPSYYDPCSLVVFEALACGLPVITTAKNGAGELITEGREGFVVPSPDDHEAMIAALEHMTRDAARREMSRHAIELGRAQSFDRHVDQLLDLCEGVDSWTKAVNQKHRGVAVGSGREVRA